MIGSTHDAIVPYESNAKKIPDRVGEEGGLFGVEEDVELDLAHALLRELLIELHLLFVPNQKIKSGFQLVGTASHHLEFMTGNSLFLEGLSTGYRLWYIP